MPYLYTKLSSLDYSDSARGTTSAGNGPSKMLKVLNFIQVQPNALIATLKVLFISGQFFNLHVRVSSLVNSAYNSVTCAIILYS